MKLVIFSDLHSHPFERFATTLPSGRNSRLQNVLDALRDITTFCREKEVDVLVFTGDLFHSRTKIDVDCFSSTWLAMRDLCRSVKHAFILRGNHDTHDKKGKIHSLEAFREFATVVDLPLIDRVCGHVFAFHPFTEQMDEWKTFVRMLPKNVDFFFAHQGISQATVGAFDISIRAEIDYTDLPHDKAKWILFGHYHAAQWLGEARRVGYVGSLLQTNFGERLEEKGFLYFEKGPDSRPFFIPTNAPKFVLYGSGEAFFDHFAGDAGDPRAPWNRDDFIRVTGCTQEQAEAIKREFPRIQVEVTHQQRFEENRVSDEVVNSDEALLSAYMEKEASNGLDHARLLEFGMGILTTEE